MPPKLPKSLQILLAKLKQAITDIFDRFEEGELTAVKWRDSMKSILTRFITASFMSGQESPLIGVTEQGYIYEYIKAQLGFIDNFYLSIVSSDEFKAGWRQRAESYANSIVAPFWKGETKMVALPAMPGDMTTPCGQLCACLWDVQTIDEEKGDYDAYWRLNASREIETEHCQICEQRSKEWAPLKIRNNMLVIPPGEAGKEFIEHIKEALTEINQKMDFVSDDQRKAVFAALADASKNSFSKSVKLYRDINDATFDIYGWKRASENQEKQFMESLDQLDPFIKDLWKGDNTDIVLASNPEWKYYGMHQTNWIVLGEESFDGGIAQHEFIHHIVGQEYIRSRLNEYSYDPMMTHASQAKGGKEMQVNEDLTCMLSMYNPDRNIWAETIIKAGEGINNLETANNKIDSVYKFIKTNKRIKSYKSKRNKDIYSFLKAEKIAFDNWKIIHVL